MERWIILALCHFMAEVCWFISLWPNNSIGNDPVFTICELGRACQQRVPSISNRGCSSLLTMPTLIVDAPLSRTMVTMVQVCVPETVRTLLTLAVIGDVYRDMDAWASRLCSVSISISTSTLARHFALNIQLTYSILCTNRDEYLHRPTQNAEFHSFGVVADQQQRHQVLSGRDEKAGGSWFGINRTGKVALL